GGPKKLSQPRHQRLPGTGPFGIRWHRSVAPDRTMDRPTIPVLTVAPQSEPHLGHGGIAASSYLRIVFRIPGYRRSDRRKRVKGILIMGKMVDHPRLAIMRARPGRGGGFGEPPAGGRSH